MKLWSDLAIEVIHGSLVKDGTSICEYQVRPLKMDELYEGSQDEITCPKCIEKLPSVTDEQIQIYIDRINIHGDPENFPSFKYYDLFNETYIRKEVLEQEFKEISEYVASHSHICLEEKLIQYGKLKMLCDLLGYEQTVLKPLFDFTKVHQPN